MTAVWGIKNDAILNSLKVVNCNKNFEKLTKVTNKSNHKVCYCSNPCKFKSLVFFFFATLSKLGRPNFSSKAHNRYFWLVRGPRVEKSR